MISFVVIGKNEGWKLTKCLQSIINVIRDVHIKKYEIIYVDSNSSDNSVERAKEFKIVKTFEIYGELNAAISRNVGAGKTKGNVLFFIDGDMEIKSQFLKNVYSEEQGLVHDFVSGNWINYYYNNSGELLKKEINREIKSDRYETVTGGLFLIKRKTWELAGGMNEKFTICEDIDLGLRLAKKGIFLFRKKDIAVIHHTIAYLDKVRMWNDFKNKHPLYARSFLYRKHFFNKHVYHRLIRNDYTLILLIIGLISFLFESKISLIFFIIYFMLIIYRSRFQPRNILYFSLRDISVLLGFFFFFPKEKKFKIKVD